MRRRMIETVVKHSLGDPMTPNYDYSYGHTPDYADYRLPDRVPDSVPEGFRYIRSILLFYFVCPLAVILNLILFIKIVRTKKISGEPWRWLIANTSLCMVFTSTLLWNRNLTTLYHTPSLLTNPACYFFEFFEAASWTMGFVTITLIIIERFHGLRLGVESRGSFSKAQAILCLAPFWIVVTLGVVLQLIIGPIYSGDPLFSYYDDTGLCYASYPTPSITHFILLWAFPTFITVFIGTLVMKGRKTTTEEMKRSIVAPTLALVCVSFILLVFPITMHMADNIFWLVRSNIGIILFDFLSLLVHLNGVAFPVIWLVTWSLTGDISMKSGNGDIGEYGEKQKNNVLKC